jgi:RNA polymerase sigma-70 factor, ECF subfamily
MASADEAALGAFYDLTIDRVFATVVRIVNNRADAEEVACEAFQQAWDRASLYDPARGSPISWLLNLAWSRAVDRVRRERRRREQPLHPDGLHTTYTEHEDDPRQRLFDALDASTAVAHAMSGLSEVQQRMLAMAFLEDLTHSEISERTGLPLGTVKSHLRRALGALRAVMEPAGGCNG